MNLNVTWTLIEPVQHLHLRFQILTAHKLQWAEEDLMPEHGAILDSGEELGI